MPLAISSPATLFDMAELSNAQSRPHWMVVREMWASGQSFAAHADSELIGIAGLYPFSQKLGIGELWMNVTPAAAPHMLPILRAAKLTIRSSGYREIVAVCASDAGKRIARAIGLTFVEHNRLGEIWRWANC